MPPKSFTFTECPLETNFGGGGQHSTVVILLATRPSCPGFESWLIDSTPLMQRTVKRLIKLIETIQYWLEASYYYKNIRSAYQLWLKSDTRALVQTLAI